jgi:hypothetical protein
MSKFFNSKFFSVLGHVLVAGIVGAATPTVTSQLATGNTKGVGALAASGALVAIVAVLKQSPLDSTSVSAATSNPTSTTTTWGAKEKP